MTYAIVYATDDEVAEALGPGCWRSAGMVEAAIAAGCPLIDHDDLNWLCD